MGTFHFPGGTFVFETYTDDTTPPKCGSEKQQPRGQTSMRDDFEGSMKRIREAHRLGMLPPTCSPQCQRRLGLDPLEAPTRTVPFVHERARRLQQFKDAVYATIFSNVRGYDSARRILSDVRSDSGLDGEQEARMLDYASFAAFLESPAMSDRVSVHEGPSGATVYRAIPNATNVHLCMEQWESAIRKQENAAKTCRRQLQSALAEN